MERFWKLLTYALTLVTAWWAGLDNAYRLLVIFQGIDIALGILTAWSKKEFRSNIGLAGVIRRAATWLFIFAVAVLEHEAKPFVSSPSLIQGVSISQAIAYAAAFFEFSSIVENSRRMGVQIPGWFVEIIKKVERTLGLSAEEKEKK